MQITREADPRETAATPVSLLSLSEVQEVVGSLPASLVPGQPADVDSYTIHANPGQVIKASTPGLSDIKISITDASGDLVTIDPSSGGAEFSVTAAGDYTIKIESPTSAGVANYAAYVQLTPVLDSIYYHPDHPALHMRLHDFDLDGRGDILWRGQGGELVAWLTTNGGVLSGALLGAKPATWQVVASGDFDGDGKTDVMWQDPTGNVVYWKLDGIKPPVETSVANPGTTWHVVGSGDFDGDGKADLLWRSDNHDVAVWNMNGSTILHGVSYTNPGANWTLDHTGDFNGDGKSDFLYRGSAGEVMIGFQDGAKNIGDSFVANPGLEWKIVGTGDFNGDGKTDIFWENGTSGGLAVWLMNGSVVAGGGTVNPPTVPGPGTDYHPVAFDDYNGDGKTDILMRSASSSGNMGVSDMDGAVAINNVQAIEPGAYWSVISV